MNRMLPKHHLLIKKFKLNLNKEHLLHPTLKKTTKKTTQTTLKNLKLVLHNNAKLN